MSNFSVIEETPSIESYNKTKIKIIGVGGGGSNAVDNMIDANLEGVEFVVINTDVQALSRSKANKKIQIGIKTTGGLGAGSDIEVGKAAAKESEEEIREELKDCNLVFLASSFGGGTGTGATPFIAQICKELNILTIAVISKPFAFELSKKTQIANAGLDKLIKYASNVIVSNNDKIIPFAPKGTSFHDLFKIDEVLRLSVQGITDLINKSGYVNVDFNDIKMVMNIPGDSIVGIGVGEGDGKMQKAAEQAISNSLMEDVSISSTKAILINITIPNKIAFEEVIASLTFITDKISNDAEVVWGYILDENLKDKVIITVILTGITSSIKQKKIKDEL